MCSSDLPSGALLGRVYKDGMSRDEIIDAKKCSVFMKKSYQGIGRGAVCGRCFAVCPKSGRAGNG